MLIVINVFSRCNYSCSRLWPQPRTTIGTYGYYRYYTVDNRRSNLEPITGCNSSRQASFVTTAPGPALDFWGGVVLRNTGRPEVQAQEHPGSAGFQLDTWRGGEHLLPLTLMEWATIKTFKKKKKKQMMKLITKEWWNEWLTYDETNDEMV